MKALVLCGGIPQIELMKDLKERGIICILADMNENVVGRKYADKFYKVSVLDVAGVKQLAILEKVDFIITVCADQVLKVMAQVSEELGLPCYIDFDTAINVSDKSYMKRIFVENNIPTSKFVIMDKFEEDEINFLRYPLIVKPIDSYSSRGVRKVSDIQELKKAFYEALEISRDKKVVIEEFVEGNELTVDAYVEDGTVHILCVSKLDKIPGSDKFVIYRTNYPANVSEEIYLKVKEIAQKITDSFKLKNTPMLIQGITDNGTFSVVEFCARTGGGDKFRLIKKVSGFDVIKAVIDLTLGNKPHLELIKSNDKYIVDEFLYCKEGVFNHLEGFEEILSENIISEYYQLKPKGTECGEIRSSGDRVAYLTIEAASYEELIEKHKIVNSRIKVVDNNDKDILRHDLLDNFEK